MMKNRRAELFAAVNKYFPNDDYEATKKIVAGIEARRTAEKAVEDEALRLEKLELKLIERR